MSTRDFVGDNGGNTKVFMKYIKTNHILRHLNWGVVNKLKVITVQQEFRRVHFPIFDYFAHAFISGQSFVVNNFIGFSGIGLFNTIRESNFILYSGVLLSEDKEMHPS